MPGPPLRPLPRPVVNRPRRAAAAGGTAAEAAALPQHLVDLDTLLGSEIDIYLAAAAAAAAAADPAA